MGQGVLCLAISPARNGLTKMFNLIQPILAPFDTASYAYAVILCWPAGRLERLHHKRSHNLADHAFPRREHDYTSALRSGRTGHQPPLDWDPVFLSKLPFMSTLLGLVFPPGRWTFPTVHTGQFHSVSTSHTHNHRINARVTICNCNVAAGGAMASCCILRHWIWSQAA